MAADLSNIIETARRDIVEALADARAELAALDARRGDLIAVIAQAELLKDSSGHVVGRPRAHLTLHEALAIVLREKGNRWMTARELADAVNDRGLYCKKDGSRVETNQVHARTKNYDQMFEKAESGIRLVEGGAAE